MICWWTSVRVMWLGSSLKEERQFLMIDNYTSEVCKLLAMGHSTLPWSLRIDDWPGSRPIFSRGVVTGPP